MPEYLRDPGTQSLHYLEFGPPDAEPLLLLHGNGADAQLYMPILAALSPYYRILAPDLPGHGFSLGVRPESVKAYLALLERFIATHIQGPYKVLGHSLGGLLSYLLLRRGQPVTRAVWMEPAIFELRPLLRASLPLYARLYALQPHIRPDVVRHLNSLAWDPRQADPVRVAAFVAAYMRSDRQVQALWLKHYPQLMPWDFSALELPLLCLRGAKDTFISRATTALVPRLPRGIEAVIPESGHCLLNENNPALVAAIQGFLTPERKIAWSK